DWKALQRVRGAVIFDYLYGAGAGIPERLLRNLSLTMVSLHAAEDPLFGGLHPEPIETYLSDLKAAVRKRRAQIGIALDGDADRLGIVDDLGRYWTPHQVFPLLVLHCIEHKGWKGKIVQSVSLGALGERIARAFGLPFEEVPVGFKHVAERMLREDVLAGGEESGGYAVRGGIPERDGVLSGLLFLEMIGARGKKPSALLREMESRFGPARFRRVDVPLARAIPDKADFDRYMTSQLPGRLAGSTVRERRTGDGLKVILENGSWLLLRPSGTEPLVRTYAESDRWPTTEQLLSWAGQTVRRYLKERGEY
ncbi:MAG TPA: phosphoglucomutase/phosphomannomutase family protein, partial [Elusimicrobiota bacterium]|nr:phosphoglucomutase/phosphomannomutase family protein [Elusimicrobiota bacterium]